MIEFFTNYIECGVWGARLYYNSGELMNTVLCIKVQPTSNQNRAFKVSKVGLF